MVARRDVEVTFEQEVAAVEQADLGVRRVVGEGERPRLMRLRPSWAPSLILGRMSPLRPIRRILPQAAGRSACGLPW